MLIRNEVVHEYGVSFAPLEALSGELNPFAKVLLMVDARVDELYGKRLDAALVNRVVQRVVTKGEGSKTAEFAGGVIRLMFEKGFTRGDAVVSAGGGATGDVAGFAAMLYMRGIDFIYVPTTYLAMCDACVGGKNGINYQCKNQIGGFYDPKSVIIDMDFLTTLPTEHYYSGLAEVIKTSLLYDEAFTELIEAKNFTTEKAVRMCLDRKLFVTQRDYFDRNYRRTLNYGHTFGHAVEALSGMTIPHGLAVAAGISLVNRFGAETGKTDPAVTERVDRLLRLYNYDLAVDTRGIAEYISRDKKSFNDKINLIMLERIGSPLICETELKEVIDFLKSTG